MHRVILIAILSCFTQAFDPSQAAQSNPLIRHLSVSSTTINQEAAAASVIDSLYKIKSAGDSLATVARFSTISSGSSPTRTRSYPTSSDIIKKPARSSSSSSRKRHKTTTTTRKRHVRTTKAPAKSSTAIHHHARLASRDTDCQNQTIGFPYTCSNNTAAGFLVDGYLQSIGGASQPVAGYTPAFTDLLSSVEGGIYLGYTDMNSYNVTQCAALCTSTTGCQSFNIYFQRSPTVWPGAACPNPTAGVIVRCVLWGNTFNKTQATNIGQWRNDFMVVMSNSALYNKNAPPASVSSLGFSDPVPLRAALQTGPIGGQAISIGNAFLITANNVSACANACLAYTASNKAAAYTSFSRTYTPCNYFNVFQVTSSGSALGFYCQLFTTSNASTNDTLYFSTYNNTTLTLTYSYGYALSTQDTGILPPDFTILSAYFVDSNITSLIRATSFPATLAANTLTFNTTFPNPSVLGPTDPWPLNSNKILTILYTFRNETRIFAAVQNTGIYVQSPTYYTPLTAQGSSLVAPPTINPPPASGVGTMRIIGMEWEQLQCVSQTAWSAVYNAYANKGSVTFSSLYFGLSDLLTVPLRSGVVWYMTAGGTLAALVGREGSMVSFPAGS